MIDKDTYISEKFIYLIMFGGIVDDYEKQDWITDINILSSLKMVIGEFVKHSYLSNEIKERIFKILSISRYIKTDNYNERIFLINDIIRLINSQIEDNSLEFYCYEMYKRFGQVFYIDDEVIDEIDDSIAYDFIFVYLHNLDPEKFENFIPEFSEFPQKYLQSFNAILTENPGIFKDKNFVINMNSVLSIIEKNKGCRKVKKINKKLKALAVELGNS